MFADAEAVCFTWLRLFYLPHGFHSRFDHSVVDVFGTRLAVGAILPPFIAANDLLLDSRNRNFGEGMKDPRLYRISRD